MIVEDKILIWKFNRGSKDALRRIYEKYKDEMLGLAITLLRDKSVAEDIVHDVFVSFARTTGNYHLSGTLKGYLSTCVANRARDRNRLRSGSDAGLDIVKKVYSHPQALGQCRSFLKHLNVVLIPSYDTAGSVKMIKESGLTDSAAIASARAAEIYGMKVIAREIEDNPNNFTRFFILASKDSPPSGNDKTSIVFSTKDRPGALYEALGEFSQRNINLAKLESRPTRQKPWQYNFYLDFEGHREEAAARGALDRVEKLSIFLKVLGSYPKAEKRT